MKGASAIDSVHSACFCAMRQTQTHGAASRNPAQRVKRTPAANALSGGVATSCLRDIPVAMVAQKVAVLAGVNRRVQKHPHHAAMAQLAKTAVTGLHAS